MSDTNLPEEVDELSGGMMWQQLMKFTNIMESLQDVGLQQHIKLPRIAVLGTQSSGKTSVLESILGLDFLPKGDDGCTRCPLELQFRHIADPNTKGWVEFDDIKKKIFVDLSKVCGKIRKLTKVVAGKNEIVERPIKLTVYSHTCANLTLIDLPGIRSTPVNKWERTDKEEITKAITLKYVRDPRTIMVVVIPANEDLATSEALKISKHLDPKGIRTVGVISKIDIMDQGTNAKRILQSYQFPLKYGYVGVKNRSQTDIISQIALPQALEIVTHPMYIQLSEDMTISTKLTQILFAHIKYHLPQITTDIGRKITDCNTKLKDLGDEIPSEDSQKMKLLLNMVNDFCRIYKNTITNRFDLKGREHQNSKELTGMTCIKQLFSNLYKEYDAEKYSTTSEYTDQDIEQAIIIHEGDSFPGFPSTDAFIYLIQPQLKKLKKPARDCLKEVFACLEKIACEAADKTFTRFPLLVDEVTEVFTHVLLDERKRIKYLLESIEQGYMCTNDADSLKQRKDIISKDTQVAKKKVELVDVCIMEMRTRIEAYFKLIARNMKELIPKLVGFSIICASKEKIQIALNTKIKNNFKNLLTTLFAEPQEDVKERERITKILLTLKNALKVLQSHPELATSLSGADLVLMNELKREIFNKKRTNYYGLRESIEPIDEYRAISILRDNMIAIESEQENIDKNTRIIYEYTNKLYYETTPEDIKKSEELVKKKCDKEISMNDSFLPLLIIKKQLESNGTRVIVQERSSGDMNCLHMLTSGLVHMKHYSYKFEENENLSYDQLDKNQSQRESFLSKFKETVGICLKIKETEIDILGIHRGSIRVEWRLKNDEKGDKEILDKEKFLSNELRKMFGTNAIFELHPYFKQMNFSEDLMDPLRGNMENWGHKDKRGGLDYFPPVGWKGYGLKVIGKYKGGEDWLAMNGNSGEWAVAYHGLRGDHIGEKSLNITKEGFKVGEGQIYESTDDINHPREKVGKGIYVGQKIEVAEQYTAPIAVGNQNYRVAFMCRIDPKKLRIPKSNTDYWVLPGGKDIRPYRILLKKPTESCSIF